MSVRTKLILMFAGIAMLVGIGASFYVIYDHWIEADEHAARHAEGSARAFAFAMVSEDLSANSTPIYKSPVQLQNFITDLHAKLKQDIELVDTQKKILGDAIPEDVGTVLDHDSNDEVGQTIRDGITRTLIETSADYPQGIRQIAVQVKTKQGEVVGALLLEYTNVYDEHIADAKREMLYFYMEALISVFMVSLIGFWFARSITNPILKLAKASGEMAAGNLDVIVEVASKDEIGDLATAFNNMVESRKLAEKKARESENRFRKLFENSNDAIFINDAETSRILDVNERVLKNLGYTREELLAMRVTDIEATLPDKFSWENHMRELDAAGFMLLEGRHRRKDGVVFPVEISVRNIQAEEKKFNLAIVRDITERKKAEEKLLESRKTIESVLNATTDALFLIDAAGNILALNETTAGRLAKKPGELIGSCIYDHLPPAIAQARKAYVDEAMRTGKTVRFEDEHNGEWLDNSIFPISDEQGKLVRAVIYGHYITDRKNAEKELKEKSANLERFNRHMVGREMRMLEMKKEVNDLLERLGEPKRYEWTKEGESS